jgi:repressor LexA
MKITFKQKKILDYYQDSKNQRPPTYRMIAEKFGVNVKYAFDTIKALERKGFIKQDKNNEK